MTRSNGLPDDEVKSIVTKDSTLFAGTTQNGIFLSRDSGATWVPCSNGLPAQSGTTSLCATKSSVLFGYYYGVYISTNDGNNWVYHGTPAHDVTQVAAVDSLIFVVGDGGIYRSTVNDTTWTNIAPLGSSENDINSILLLDTELIVGTGSGVFVSFDDGNTWSNQSAGLTNPPVESLAVFNSELVAGLYRVAPSISAIWRRPLSGMIESDYILGVKGIVNDTIAFGRVPLGNLSLRIATAYNAGFAPLTIQPLHAPGNEFETSDLSGDVDLLPGESFTFEVFFQPTDTGFHSAILSFVSEAKKVNIYLTGTGYTNDDVKNDTGSNSRLNSYPNPFSQSTQITFTSPSAGCTEVSIVNMLGLEVARVFSGEVGAGEHSFQWDAGKDAGTTGVYECLVRMNGQVQTLPVVLMR